MSVVRLRRGSFQPTDLNIIAQAYESAWAIIEVRQPYRDRSKDEALKKALRKRVITCAGAGLMDAVALRNKALLTMSECWRRGGA